MSYDLLIILFLNRFTIANIFFTKEQELYAGFVTQAIFHASYHNKWLVVLMVHPDEEKWEGRVAALERVINQRDHRRFFCDSLRGNDRKQLKSEKERVQWKYSQLPSIIIASAV